MSKKVLFLSNHFITLYSYRKELIAQLVAESNEVFISMPKTDENSFFTDMGCKLIETPMDRRGVNPFSDIKLILKYTQIIKQVNPDIIFSYTIKPNIYGSIASNLTGYKQVCNITGTGGTFLDRNTVSTIAKHLYKLSVKQAYKVFFQNTGDRDYFIQNGMIKDNYEMLPGSGVNLEQYGFCELPPEDNISFIFIGRVMKLKGIDQYLECAKNIKAKYPNTTFYIAGYFEDNSYKAIFEEYQAKEIVNYIGFERDIKPWIQKCHCTILPSHGGEGVPNVLLESAAMGRVCIASRINGSKDVVDDGVTGYLFEAGNTEDLVGKVCTFIGLDFEVKKQMGQAGRNKVEHEFNREKVIETYLREAKLLGKGECL